MDALYPEGSVARKEHGPLESAIADAVKHTPAVVVVSVEADGTVTFGYHILNSAPTDVLMRLMCGTQSALELLGQMITAPTDEKVH